jgi:hypothetical protein
MSKTQGDQYRSLQEDLQWIKINISIPEIQEYHFQSILLDKSIVKES